jgi:hypothetical protein
VETPSGSSLGAGRPTVRKAELLSGSRMTKKRTPAAERRRETTVVLISALLLMVVEQPAGHGSLVIRRESELTWSGEPQRKTMTTRPRTNGQTRRRGQPAGVRGPADDPPADQRADRKASRSPEPPRLAWAGCIERRTSGSEGGPALRGAGPTRYLRQLSPAPEAPTGLLLVVAGRREAEAGVRASSGKDGAGFLRG